MLNIIPRRKPPKTYYFPVAMYSDDSGGYSPCRQPARSTRSSRQKPARRTAAVLPTLRQECGGSHTPPTFVLYYYYYYIFTPFFFFFFFHDTSNKRLAAAIRSRASEYFGLPPAVLFKTDFRTGRRGNNNNNRVVTIMMIIIIVTIIPPPTVSSTNRTVPFNCQ